MSSKKNKNKGHKANTQTRIFCRLCFEELLITPYLDRYDVIKQHKCPIKWESARYFIGRDDFNSKTTSWPLIYQQEDYKKYCSECCNELNHVIYSCNSEQWNAKNCPFFSKDYKSSPLCKNCIVICPTCLEMYCKTCWKISEQKTNENYFPCISHKHCKQCIKKPSICNVIPMSACRCGCGDYQSDELIWSSISDKKKWNDYLKIKYH